MTRDEKIYRIAYWLASFIIAAILLSGYYKILHPEEFALAVYRFRILPGILVNPVSLYLTWLEVVCALCLLFIPRFRVAALQVVLVLLILFTTGIALNLMRGTLFGCGCFGSAALSDPLGGITLLRNLALILLTALGLLAHKRAAA
jgi:hypothetical protein